MRWPCGARDANAEWLGARVLYLMPDAWRTFLAFLEAKFPRLVVRYREWYGRNVDAPESYRKEMAARVEKIRGKYGLSNRPMRPTPVLRCGARRRCSWHLIKEKTYAEPSCTKQKDAQQTASGVQPSRDRADAGRGSDRPKKSRVRGVRLKTVSTFTLVFALLCVAAFAAGRPPAAEMGAGSAMRRRRWRRS